MEKKSRRVPQDSLRGAAGQPGPPPAPAAALPGPFPADSISYMRNRFLLSRLQRPQRKSNFSPLFAD